MLFDSKHTFREHTNYMAEKCTKLIFVLSRLAKLNWGLTRAALKTIHTGGILLVLLYRAPVWKEAIEKVSYKLKLIGVQRLIKIAKAYCMVSNEALCILTGLTPFSIKIEEATQFYELTSGSKKEGALVDCDMEVKDWHDPTETITIHTKNIKEMSTIQTFTDGSKSERGWHRHSPRYIRV
jgi:hypothetical protein